MFYINFYTCNYCENEAPLRGRHAVLKGGVQTLRREELVLYVLISPLIDWHVLHIPKLVLTRCGSVETKRPYATDGSVVTNCRYIRFE